MLHYLRKKANTQQQNRKEKKKETKKTEWKVKNGKKSMCGGQVGLGEQGWLSGEEKDLH